jgi:hypothetical protein
VYDSETAAGDAVNVAAVPTSIVTGKETYAAGGLSKWTTKVVLPTAKPPHPTVGCTVSATGVEAAVPPVNGVTESHEGSTATVLSTVNGVPPGAGDVTFTFTAAPRVSVDPLLVQVRFTALGEGARADALLVTTSVAVTVIAVPPAGVNVSVVVVVPGVAMPLHPAARLKM